MKWGRKFWLVSLTELASALLLLADKLDSGGFVTITLGIVATYVTGNVMQKRNEVIKNV